MKMKNLLTLGWVALCLGACSRPAETVNTLRAPAYPLFTVDPYGSVWSMTDSLYGDHTRHWTTEPNPLIGAIRVDGVVYRFMGSDDLRLDPIPGAGMALENPNWPARYTKQTPRPGWEQPGFDDRDWLPGQGALGTKRETAVGTNLNFSDTAVWVRRQIELPEDLADRDIVLEYSHDDIFSLYINGIEVASSPTNTREKNVRLVLPAEVKKTLKRGKNLIAAEVRNTEEFYLIDFGLYDQASHHTYLPRTARQTSVDLQPTRTRYAFQCGPVELKVDFVAPLLLDDLEVMARPVNYISYDLASTDGQAHDIQLYFEMGREWGINYPYDESCAATYVKDGYAFLKHGSTAQQVLGRKGDNVRLDWGYFYLAAPAEGTTLGVGTPGELRTAFVQQGRIDSLPTQAVDRASALVRSLGSVDRASGRVMVGCDDLYSLQFFGENLRGYWNRKGDRTIEQLFIQADAEYPALAERCRTFDAQLMADARRSGGVEYAELCALAYRQAIAAHKLLEAPNGELLFISKENFSNGCAATVDVSYPSSPLFLYYNPDLVKGMLNPIFFYCESDRWSHPFACHDIGTYPLANGQVYGGNMPVEESGNMLLLMAAITAREGSPDYARQHWDILTTWADYLVQEGLDPANQLCTDDFGGSFAHNANLSIKAILGIAAYGYLAGELGDSSRAAQYTAEARRMATEWERMANDGDHYRLTFDRPGTWSQKYNLVWDRIMGWEIFPDSVARKEIASYLPRQNRYGLPLDSRQSYTKADWIAWTSALSADVATRQALLKPMWLYMNEAVDRLPMTDWYRTERNFRVGAIARSVVGGLYMPMLADKLAPRE